MHTGGSTWSASDPGLTDKYKHSHVLPPSYTQLTTDPEARRFQHAVLTNTHKHSHTQGLAQIPSSGPSSLVDLDASGACLTLPSLALPRMPSFWL